MLIFWITIGGNKTNGFFLQIDDLEDELVFCICHVVGLLCMKA
jgi:hypothetical protein